MSRKNRRKPSPGAPGPKIQTGADNTSGPAQLDGSRFGRGFPYRVAWRKRKPLLAVLVLGARDE